MRIPGVPIRLKIMLGLLVVIGTTVGVITFTVARLFHVDKRAYVSDLVSVTATNSAQEAGVLAAAYRDRLEVLAVLADAPDMPLEVKTITLKKLLNEFPGLLAVRFQENGHELLSLSDDLALAGAGLTRSQLTRALSEPVDPGEIAGMSGVRILNATISPRLPAFSATILHSRGGGKPPIQASAIVRLDDFERIARGSHAFDIILTDAKGLVMAAKDPELVARRTRLSRPPATAEAVIVREYTTATGPKLGGSARVQTGGVSAIAELPRSAAFIASRFLLVRLMLVSLVLLVLAAIVAAVWSGKITRSIAQLARAAQEVGRGNFRTRVKVTSRDEMGALATSFNRMATELDERERALKTARAALIQSEKLAAFGQLGAGIAHEVKNPLAGIQALVQLTMRQADPSHPFREPLATIEKETKRCRAIIDNLLKFARQEKVPRQPTDVDGIVSDTIAIMHHQLALHGVAIEPEIEPGLPRVMASPNQLQQVLMNLILNADQAFQGKPGQVRLEAAHGPENGVILRVRDNGPGIPEDIIERIFEPFFTTKPVGEGTGLGLSVSFGIVRDHGGRIEVQSAPEQGTTFTITLPAMEAAASHAAPVAVRPPPASGIEQRAA